MEIRKAEPVDAGKISCLVQSLSKYYLVDSEAELPNWFSKTLELSSFEKRILSDEYSNFIALHNDQVIGYISIKGRTHLYHLFVDERYHGQGIATQLWRHAKSSLSIEQCTLRSSLFAVPVYERLGFRVSAKAEEKEGIGYQPMELSNS